MLDTNYMEFRNGKLRPRHWPQECWHGVITVSRQDTTLPSVFSSINLLISVLQIPPHKNVSSQKILTLAACTGHHSDWCHFLLMLTVLTKPHSRPPTPEINILRAHATKKRKSRAFDGREIYPKSGETCRAVMDSSRGGAPVYSIVTRRSRLANRGNLYETYYSPVNPKFLDTMSVDMLLVI